MNPEEIQIEKDQPTRRPLEEQNDAQRTAYKTKHGAGSPYQAPEKDWSAEEHPAQKSTSED